MFIDQLQTPVALVDLDKLEDNIGRLQSYLDSHGITNWPHIKTHKIPAIAQKQIAAGAVGITCQKLGEAEIMAQAGIQNIFLPYNLVGQAKLDRLMRLAEQIRISVTADSAFVVDGLGGAALRTHPVPPGRREFRKCETPGKLHYRQSMASWMGRAFHDGLLHE